MCIDHRRIERIIMKFTKMQGIGNDYIYFDCTRETIKNPEELAIKLSDRYFGVGGDGIVLIMSSDIADFRMRMFNADGSEGKMCGNASRCIGKYVYERGLTDKKDITLETLSGIKTLHLEVYKNNRVKLISVDMGKAVLDPKSIPIDIDGERVVAREVNIAGQRQRITAVSMGNPHCVIFTDKDIAGLELEKFGPRYEYDPLFPEKVNTEFINVISETELKMRVWERGSGETLACGTGACAAVAAAVLNGYCEYDTDITVYLTGGKLKIRYNSDGGVIMKGTAEFVFDGEAEE